MQVKTLNFQKAAKNSTSSNSNGQKTVKKSTGYMVAI